MKKIFYLPLAVLLAVCPACSSNEEDEPLLDEGSQATKATLFIVNQGNFQYGNSSLTVYDPETDLASQEVFYKANGFKLGDLAQSMTIAPDGSGWVVVNNSNVIFAIDTDTYKEKGRITSGIISPRFIHFVSKSKAYVTQMYDNRIAIVDPEKYAVTGYIEVPGMDVSTGSTEMMVQVDDFVYVNCWSYNNTIIRVNTRTDKVEGSVTTPIQPKAMTLDADNNIWAVTDGGYYGSPYGYENPTLLKVNTKTFAIDLSLQMELGANITSIVTNGDRTRLYWISNDVYTMPVTSTTLPAEPIISANGNWLQGLTVDPVKGDIYVADALDYVQAGQLLRYSPEGEFITTVPTGVIPGSFCWK